MVFGGWWLAAKLVTNQTLKIQFTINHSQSIMENYTEWTNGQLYEEYTDFMEILDELEPDRRDSRKELEVEMEAIMQEINRRGHKTIGSFGKHTAALYYGNYATLEEYTASLNS